MPAKKQLKKPAAKPQKVVAEQRPPDKENEVIEDEKYRCSCCGKHYTKQQGNFNVTRSPIYQGNNGYMSICKKCLNELYTNYVAFYDGDTHAAIERICQLTDMCMDEGAYEAAKKSNIQSKVSAYIQKLNLLQANTDLTYCDTEIRRWEYAIKEAEDKALAEARERQIAAEEAVKREREKKQNALSEECIRRFGLGFEVEEYDTLQYEYDNWVERYGEPIDKRQEELYVSICYMKLNLQKNIQSGGSGSGQLANSYKSLIEAATVEIEDRKRKEEERIDLLPVGVLIHDIEQYCPAEFYKNNKLYEDEDGLASYFKRFLVRPFRNLITGSKDKDEEFSVGDDTDA